DFGRADIESERGAGGHALEVDATAASCRNGKVVRPSDVAVDVDKIVADAAIHDVAAVAIVPDQEVVAVLALQVVGAARADQHVVADAAAQNVGVEVADQAVAEDDRAVDRAARAADGVLDGVDAGSAGGRAAGRRE